MNDAGAANSVNQRHQEAFYNEDVSYRTGSPHLSHWWLYDRLVEVLRECLRKVSADGLPLRVLEIGSGHGGYTEPVLAAGCQVTAVEMSRPSLENIGRRYGSNSNFHTVFDPDGSLENVDDGFSLVLVVSVLHHIPDYVSFLRSAVDRLVPGGWLLTLQDPLWYPRLSRMTRVLDRTGYFTWRLTQGNLHQALATRLRRLRGVYDPQNPADMVEYHVVRHGVEEQEVLHCLQSQFETLKLMPYWSSQASYMQRLGEHLKLSNTFGVVASGYIGRDRPSVV